MASSRQQHLWKALDFRLSEILRIDFAVGAVFGAAAFTLALVHPDALLRGVSAAVGVVGVIVGAVIAAISFQAAFMDQAFLRKLRAIGRDPVYYLTPFLFTATLGVVAMLLLVIVSTFTPTMPKLPLAIFSAFTAFTTAWTIASLIPGLATLVQFVGLKVDALDVPDDIDLIQQERRPAA